MADQAEVENFRYQVRATQQWLKEMADAPVEWRRAAGATDSLVNATVEQLADLHRRLGEVLSEWSRECMDDEQQRPDAVRRHVRTLIRCFPSKPVRP